jgi:transcriptional regulator with XRE-family HTH domain
MSFGACLKTLRMRLSTKQLWLSGEIGCTDAAISYWETGRRLPQQGTLFRLVEVFRKNGASPDELYELRLSWSESRLRRSSGRWPID